MPPDATTNPSSTDGTGPSAAPTWILIVGIIALFLAAFFFMGLVIAGILNHPVPCNTKPFAHIVLAILLALGSAFLGGWARAEGKIPSLGELVGLSPKAPGSESSGSPIAFGVGGGVAVFVVVFLLASWVDRCTPEPHYKLEIVRPARVSTPPPPANKDWLVTIDFAVEPIPPGNFSLMLEFCQKPDFKQLLTAATRITSPERGQVIDQIPSPESKQAWARLVLKDTTGDNVAISSVVQIGLEHVEK
jgi:hypothetical protein